MIPPSSFVSSVYCASPTESLSRSLERVPCRSSSARGPSTSSSPMCETSKTPASVRTARCSGITPAYCTGMSQPANGTIRAPSSTCRSWSGVCRSVSGIGTADPSGGREPPAQSKRPQNGAAPASSRDETGAADRVVRLTRIRSTLVEGTDQVPRFNHVKPVAAKRVKRPSRGLLVAQEGRHVEGLLADVLGSARRNGDRGLHTATAPAASAAEARRDDGDAHLGSHRLVDDGTEDDVRARLGDARHDLRRLVHPEHADVR